MRSRLLLTGAVAAMLAGLASPAGAATSGDTTVTFSVTGGALSITVPASSTLPSGAPGTTVSGQLGTVAVTDGRALLNAAWSASAASTDFATGAKTAAETITKNKASYWSGPGVSQGSGTFTAGQPTAVQKQSLGLAVPAFSLASGTGSNSVVWTPTVEVAVPAAAVAGTYFGTVTHSVA